MTYTLKELDLIAVHINGFVKQDDDGNVVWNSCLDVETGWRPVSAEKCREAIETGHGQ